MTLSLDVGRARKLELPHPNHLEEGHAAPVYAIQYRGSYLVSGSADRTVRIWNVDTQRLLRGPLIGHQGSVVCLQFDETLEADVIISGGVDGEIIVWQFSTGRIVRKIDDAHSSTVLSLAFNGRFLVSGGKDSKIKLWNREAINKPCEELPEYVGQKVAIFGSPDPGQQITRYALLKTLEELASPVNTIVLQDSCIISGSGDSTVAVWSIETGNIIRKLLIHDRGICALNANGRHIVSGSSDNTCRVYDMEEQSEVACLRGHSNIVRALCVVSQDDSSLGDIVTGSYDGTIRYWKQDSIAKQWTCHKVFDSGDFQPSAVAYATRNELSSHRVFDLQFDSARLFASGDGPVIKIWVFSESAVAS